MKKSLVFVVYVCLLALLVVGCGETYDMETDTEFHTAVDDAIEQSLRGEDVFDKLFEEFSDRYDEEEIDEFAAAKLVDIQNEIMAKIDGLNQRAEEHIATINGQIENLGDVSHLFVSDEMLEEYQQAEKRVEELDAEYKESEDIYRQVEILEEMVELLEGKIAINEERIEFFPEAY